MLLPLERLIFDMLQLVVPLDVPLLPVALFDHVTLLIPLSSEAVPLRVMELLAVEYVESDVGLVMVTTGAVVSVGVVVYVRRR